MKITSPIKNGVGLPNMELSVEDQKIREDLLTYLLRKIHQPNQKVIPVWWGDQTQKESNGYDIINTDWIIVGSLFPKTLYV